VNEFDQGRQRADARPDDSEDTEVCRNDGNHFAFLLSPIEKTYLPLSS
jgi:hypothetical protein